jgi:polyisoprenoid-binding protein YceI
MKTFPVEIPATKKERKSTIFLVIYLLPMVREKFKFAEYFTFQKKIMSTVKWKLDLAHSEITFKVKHLMITTVTGRFNKFNVELETENDDFLAASKIVFTADVNSIDTNNEPRDTHLKSEDFFNVDEHSEIKFTAEEYFTVGTEATLNGQLTIRGIERLVMVTVEFGGLVKDTYGQTKVGFSVSGKISRKEFGLVMSMVTEAGNVVVGDEIKFQGEIQLIKQN